MVIKNFLQKNYSFDRIIHYQKNLSTCSAFNEQVDAKISGQLKNLKFNYYETIPSKFIEENGVKINHRVNKDIGCLMATWNGEYAGHFLFNLKGKAELLYPFSWKADFGIEHVYGFALFVKEQYRTQGVAKLLYQKSFDFFKDNFKWIDVFVNAEKFVPNKLVQGLGFFKVKEFVLIKFFIFRLIFYLDSKNKKTLFEIALCLARVIKKMAKLLISPLIWAAAKINIATNNLFMRMYYIESSHEGQTNRVIFICRNAPDKTLLNRIFGNEKSIILHKILRRNKSLEELDNSSNKADITIIEDSFDYISNRPARLRGAYLVPKWVSQKNYCFKGMSDFKKTKKQNKNSSAFADIAKTKKFNYGYLFSKNNYDLLKFFYYDMYVPYINNRYKDEKYLASYGEVKSNLNKGGLLLIKYKDKFVSGCIVQISAKALFPTNIGVLNGDYKLVKEGVLVALYYFYCKLAEDNDLTVINYGLSKPFLNDGVLRYKAKWNTKVEFDRKRSTVFAFKINRLSKFSRNFLLNNPFISLEGGRLKGNIFYDANYDKESINKKYMLKGLDAYKIIDFNNNLSNETNLLSDLPCEQVSLYSAPSIK